MLGIYMLPDKTVTIFQVDAFTSVPFKGNPAGVCIVEEPLSIEMMQNIAMEMNLSETAFVWPFAKSDIRKMDKFFIQWFTPACEAPLCGHATLAAGKVLCDIFEIASKRITFISPHEELYVERRGDYFQLDFPAADFQQIKMPDYLFHALRLDKADVEEQFLEACHSRNGQMLLLRFKSIQAIEKITPDYYELFHAQDAIGCREVVVTARGRNDYDYVSRCFAPILGIEEDPVSGASHMLLGPYWGVLLDKKRMIAYQASRRGGKIIVELRKESPDSPLRVLIMGQAVIVMEAQIHLAPEIE